MPHARSIAEAEAVPGEPVSFRFEQTEPPHHKFYEVEVELCFFYPKTLIRRWGRIGTRNARSLRMVIDTPEELRRHVNAITGRRRRHGYRTVTELRVPSIGGSAA
jgi:predicted DNA-binding WGR domain protein